jgi:large subunit ribosomal protein L32
MAVPKKKKSSSRSRMRRGSNGTNLLPIEAIATNKEGEDHYNHHISPNGFYKGRQVIVKKEKQATEQPE